MILSFFSQTEQISRTIFNEVISVYGLMLENPVLLENISMPIAPWDKKNYIKTRVLNIFMLKIQCAIFFT